MKFSRIAISILFALAVGIAASPAFAQLEGGLEVPAGCGDKIVIAPEQCDDGNGVDGDGCNIFCQYEAAKPIFPVDTYCGDGIVNTKDETCDDANNLNGDGCDSNCHAEFTPIFPVEAECGNGVLVKGEDCDDGNSTGSDGCDSSCKIEVLVKTPPTVEADPPPAATVPGNIVQPANENEEIANNPSHFSVEQSEFSMVGGGCSILGNSPTTSPWISLTATLLFATGFLALSRRSLNQSIGSTQGGIFHSSNPLSAP